MVEGGFLTGTLSGGTFKQQTEESELGKEYSPFSSLLPFHIPLSKKYQPEGMETSLCIPQTWRFGTHSRMGCGRGVWWIR